MSAIYELLQSKRSSSSGTGTSYYGTAATCGMKARLQEDFPYEEEDYDGTGLTATGKRKVNGRRAGTFFHALQEMWRLEQIPDDMIIAADHSDYDFELAMNSFCKYRAHFKNDRHNLGIVTGVEKRLPEIDANGNLTPLGEQQHERILTFTGGIPFSIRYDLRTTIDMDCRGRIAVERELALPRCGAYLIDHKLIGSISRNTMWEYSYGFQQLAYPIIHNICCPDEPIVGMLTEATARVINPEPRHFALYLAYADERAEEIVRHGIFHGSAAHELGKANPFACNGKFGPCYFLTTGLCPRHGYYDNFTFEGGQAHAKPESED